MSKSIGVTRFTTSQFAPADRHEAWANRDYPNIGPVFDTTPTGVFHNHAERFALGALSVHYSDMGGQTYHRTAERRRADDIDHLAVSIMLTGEARGVSADRSAHLTSGEISLVDLARDHSHASTDARSFLLLVPRGFAEGCGLDMRQAHGAVIGRGASSLLRTHLIEARRGLATLDTQGAARLGQETTDLLTVAFTGAGSGVKVQPRARDTAILMRARQLIEAELASPALDLAMLCRRIGVSRSALYRLFEAEGGVLAYIRERRLEAVRAALEHSDTAPASRIGDLAAHWGFSDAAHLSRLFRARYGAAPSDYRMERAARFE